jgi:predicted SAM-dependent methyltransferase
MKFLDFSQTKLSLRRNILSYSKIQALISGLLRNKKYQFWGEDLKSKDYLNCGCGINFKDGFINLDFNWKPGIDLCWDVTIGLPFSNNSLKGIYTEHMLEHIPFDKVVYLLTEFRRVLKKGGTVRIIVPDAELYLGLYQSAKESKNVVFPYGGSDTNITPMMHVNNIFRKDGHQFAYDYETLRILLNEAGFSIITRMSFNRGNDINLLIDQKRYEISSLYVEAIV